LKRLFWTLRFAVWEILMFLLMTACLVIPVFPLPVIPITDNLAFYYSSFKFHEWLLWGAGMSLALSILVIGLKGGHIEMSRREYLLSLEEEQDETAECF